jgi:hypothetical protein
MTMKYFNKRSCLLPSDSSIHMYRSHGYASNDRGTTGGNVFYVVHDEIIPSVHCVGLSDVWEPCQYVISGLTAGFPNKLKVIHSVIT